MAGNCVAVGRIVAFASDVVIFYRLDVRKKKSQGNSAGSNRVVFCVHRVGLFEEVGGCPGSVIFLVGICI